MNVTTKMYFNFCGGSFQAILKFISSLNLHILYRFKTANYDQKKFNALVLKIIL